MPFTKLLRRHHRSGVTFVVRLLWMLPLLPYLRSCKFIKEYPEYVAENNSMSFLSNNHGTPYNRCHRRCPPIPWPCIVCLLRRSVKELRNSRHGFLAHPCLYLILRLSRLEGSLLLRGEGIYIFLFGCQLTTNH